mmetsp:Transcript_24319/g.40839  ORF Transcript_24319/g.40839 Transcript_24319/m.40839 type:complete len:93 (-) Transcript_24319:432-710(-)
MVTIISNNYPMSAHSLFDSSLILSLFFPDNINISQICSPQTFVPSVKPPQKHGNTFSSVPPNSLVVNSYKSILTTFSCPIYPFLPGPRALLC